MKFLLFLIQTDAAVPQQFEECSPSTEAMFQTLRLVPGGKISVCVRRTLQRGSAMTTGSLEQLTWMWESRKCSICPQLPVTQAAHKSCFLGPRRDLCCDLLSGRACCGGRLHHFSLWGRTTLLWNAACERTKAMQHSHTGQSEPAWKPNIQLWDRIRKLQMFHWHSHRTDALVEHLTSSPKTVRWKFLLALRHVSRLGNPSGTPHETGAPKNPETRTFPPAFRLLCSSNTRYIITKSLTEWVQAAKIVISLCHWHTHTQTHTQKNKYIRLWLPVLAGKLFCRMTECQSKGQKHLPN